MLVEALTRFRDLKANAYREAGERFEVDPKRLAEINGAGYGMLVRKAEETPKLRRTRKPKED